MSELHAFTATGEMVILTRGEYERLIDRSEQEADVRAFDDAVAEIEAGGEVLPGSFVERLVDTDSLVREWRVYRHLSQAKLAEAAGVRQATISAIEKGSSPRLDTARKIADVLECDLDDLF